MGVLRFFLALSVVFTHAGSFSGFFLGDGRLAVQAFYMVSGFYMSMVWTEKYSNYASPIRTFYTSRMLRIYPMYILVVGLTLVLALFVNIPPIEFAKAHEAGWGTIIWSYLTQITLLGMESSVFLGNSGYWISPVAWTLGLELAFYLLVPLLIPRPWLAVMVIAMSLGGRYLTYLYMGWGSGNPDYALIWSYRFFPFEIALFLAGAFSYSLFNKFSTFLAPLLQLPEVPFAILIGLVSWLCYFQLLNPRMGEWVYWLYYAIVFFSLWLLFQSSKKSKLDSYIGELSYPIYMAHLPVLWMVSNFAKPENTIYAVIPITLLASMALVRFQLVVDRYRHGLRTVTLPMRHDKPDMVAARLA